MVRLTQGFRRGMFRYIALAIVWLFVGGYIALIHTTPAPTAPKGAEDGPGHTIVPELRGGEDINNTLERAADFRKGPYLQNVNTTAVTVSWESTEPSTGVVYYGKTEGLGHAVNDTLSDTFHEVRIEGLEPNTMYYYMVDIGSVQSPVATFYTAPNPWDSYRIIFYGDSRSNPSVHNTISNLILQEQPRIVFNTGDLVEDGDVDSQWDEMHFTPARTLMMFTPMYVCLGNHEHHASQYYKYFQLPGEGGEERWYSFDFGNIHFIAISSEDDYLSGSEQYAWIEADLQNASAEGKWIIAYWHRPPYNTGVSHGTGNPSGPEATDMRDTVCTLLEQYGAQFVFNGHEHIYQHAIVNGIHYIITAGGGAFLSYYGGSHDWTVVCSDRSYHYVIMDFTPFTVNVTAKRSDGSIIESFTHAITPVDYPPAPPTDVAAYDTPSDNGGSITVEWGLSRDDGGGWNDISHYEVLRADGSPIPSNFQSIATLPPGTKTFRDDFVEDGTNYYYMVRAWDKSNHTDSAIYGPVTSMDNTPPYPPQGLSVKDRVGDNGNALVLEWSPSPSADVVEQYLYRSTTADITNTSEPLCTFGPDVSEYVDENVSYDTDYYYALAASDGKYISPLSSIVGPVHPLWDGAPSPPTIIKAEDRADDTGGAIVLEWSLSEDDGAGGDVVSYSINRRSEYEGSFKEIATVDSGTSSYVDDSVENGVGYYYMLRAYDGHLYSANSNIAGPVYAIDNTIPWHVEEARITDYGDTWVKLKWRANEDTITVKYRIYINGSDSTVPDEVALEVPHSDGYITAEIGDLTPSTTYTFLVLAVSKYQKEGPYTSDDFLQVTLLSPPVIKAVNVTPERVGNDGAYTAVVKAQVDDLDGIGDIVYVAADLSNLGLSDSEAMYDDGTHGDGLKGDGWYSVEFNIKAGTKVGTYNIRISAFDAMDLKATALAQITVVDAETLKNHKPSFTSWSPSSFSVSIALGEHLSFSVSVEDEDDNLKEVKWFVDDGPGGKGTELECQFDTPGSHKVVAIATDENGAISTLTWNVNVADGKEGSDGGSGKGDGKGDGEGDVGHPATHSGDYTVYYAVVAVIALVVVFIAFIMLKRRGGGEGKGEGVNEPPEMQRSGVDGGSGGPWDTQPYKWEENGDYGPQTLEPQMQDGGKLPPFTQGGEGGYGRV